MMHHLIAVAVLVDSIRKHKKFKQLASYSIQCLEKVVAPPRLGWEVGSALEIARRLLAVC